MSSLTQGAEGAKAENLISLFVRSPDPKERRRLTAEILNTYKPRIAAVVRRVLRTPQHWAEAEQVGALGLLVALREYRPAEAEADRGGAFWGFARFHVMNEIQRWIDVGVYWRKTPNRGRGEARAANREAARTHALHVEYQDDEDHRVDENSPEALVIAAELRAQVEGFVLALTEDERKTALAERPSGRSARHYRTIVSRARAAFRDAEAKARAERTEKV